VCDIILIASYLKMGKGLNPADAERKAQKKKDIAKFKKQRAETNEVRQLLSDPDRIDEQLQNLKKESESNKLDLNLKNKIKEMQKMKDIAVKKLENQKILEQMKANSLRGIQEAERHDKNLKSNSSSSVKTDHHHQPKPPQQTPRSLLVGGLHGIPLPPPPMVGGPRQIPQTGMMPLMPGMMPLMPGMMPMQGTHQNQQSNANPRVPKRQNRTTSNYVDPMDPKGENYVERFIGHDRLQKQQQQNQRLQVEKQQQQLLQEQQIQEVQKIEDNESKWSQFETDIEQVENEMPDSKWSMYETQMDESQNENGNERQISIHENENEAINDPAYEIPHINPEDIMKRRFALNDSADISDAIPGPSINIEELMRRRNIVPDIDESLGDGPSLGPSVPMAPYEIYQSLQSLPTVEDLLQNRHNEFDDDAIKPTQAIEGGLLGLCQYDSDDEDDNVDDVSNYRSHDPDVTSNNNPQYALNIPIQPVLEIEQKKTAPVKIKADAALTSFVPSSLKMKRPNQSLTIKKAIPTTITTSTITTVVGDTENSKDDAYAKFLAEITGL